jgi:hypothetical protein
MRSLVGSLLVLATAALAAAVAALGVSPTVDPTVAAKHDADPVILTGADFPQWSARANFTVKIPSTDLKDCSGTIDPSRGGSPNDWLVADEGCEHNTYAAPEVDTGHALGTGTPTDQLVGYRWDADKKEFVQIPFQVDELFTRYLQNSASGFALYSGQDQHTTYAFDREGFRYRTEDTADPCHALPDGNVAADPVQGLDDNDELVFMARDAGAQAPAKATLPAGIDGVREVTVADPANPQEPVRYAYVMRTGATGPKPAFNASTGYVQYTRDANADTFGYSQSGYRDYGNAPRGRFMWNGQCVGASVDNAPAECKDAPDRPPSDSNMANLFFKCPQRHRPLDGATVETDGYKFRYDGRWLLTGLQISPDGGTTFGPDLIDRWKARAFAQDPYSDTPCCGYEDEDQNWGGSSNLIGERVGPVRAIRETWGADSGTNVIRRETFYRDTMRQKTFLRVHVIPPLDGIYAQWDFNAGKVDTYFNPRKDQGVDIDGKNDEVFGNFDDPCVTLWDDNSRSDFDQAYRDAYKQMQFCRFPNHLSIDVTDPTFANVNASLDWNEVAGPNGSIVDRYQLEKVTDATALGTPQTLFAVPYYRDDSCFDDGTGSDPGVRLQPRSDNEPQTFEGQPRKCWQRSDGDPAGSPRYFQGDIATHGLHLLLIAESDNARLTVPVTEIVSEQRMVFLPGNPGNVGEQYGRSFEKPLVAATTPYEGTAPTGSTPPPVVPPSDPGTGSGGEPQKPGAPPGSNGGADGGSGFNPPPARSSDQGSVAGQKAASCLSARQKASRRGIGRLRLGDTSARTIKKVGKPTGVTQRMYGWCVARGGKLVVVFSSKGRVQLIAFRRSAKAKLVYRADRRLSKKQVRRLLRSA